MNKKLIFCLLIIFTLCSCSIKPETAKYSTQENINFNYNNINSGTNIWLTNENLCYLEDNLKQYYYRLNENGKKKICSNNGYGFGEIQDYGDKIYMLDFKEEIDEENALYSLKYYDVKQKIVNDVLTIANCGDFCVLGDDILYLQFSWLGNRVEYSLWMYSPTSKTRTKINNSLFSFGIINNEVYYLTEVDGTISVFKYDKLANSSVDCGSFELNQSYVRDFKELAEISYTPNYIMFALGVSQNHTTVWNFSLKDKSIKQFDLEKNVSSFISYDECSYFIADENNSETIYKFVNKTGKTTKIAQFPVYCGLFVGSDYGVYVVEYESNKIFYCSEKSTPKLVGNY